MFLFLGKRAHVADSWKDGKTLLRLVPLVLMDNCSLILVEMSQLMKKLIRIIISIAIDTTKAGFITPSEIKRIHNSLLVTYLIY